LTIDFDLASFSSFRVKLDIMTRIETIVSTLQKDWEAPKHAVHGGKESAWFFYCLFEETGVLLAEDFPYKVSQDLKDFWSISKEAILFKDIQHGQWGLKVLSPKEALHETEALRSDRPQEYRHGDLVIGTFYGDQDLLILCCDDNSPVYGSLIVAEAIDKRIDWRSPAATWVEFLEKFYNASGEKYWEQHYARDTD
jgi:hypothetical protein